MSDEKKKTKTKNEIIATIFDSLVVLSAIVISSKGFVDNNFEDLLMWGAIPGGFLTLSIMYKLPAIGAGLVAITKFMDIGGMPIVGLIILAFLFGFYLYSQESKILEIIKYFVGFVAGAFVQKKRTPVLQLEKQ